MLTSFFLLSGLWLWLVIAASLGFLVWALEEERPGIATFDVLLTLSVVAAFTHINPLTWVYENPILFVGGAVGYLLIGTAWAVLGKWQFFLLKKSAEFAVYRQNFIDKWNSKVHLFYKNGVPTSHVRSNPWTVETGGSELVSDACQSLRVKSLPPKVADNKGRILVWMMYWPVSMLWTLLNDPVKYAFEYVQELLTGFMQAMSDRAFKKFEEIQPK